MAVGRICSLILVLTFACAAVADENGRVKAGVELFRAGKVADALVCLQQQTGAGARFWTGRCKFEMGRFQAAADQFARAMNEKSDVAPESRYWHGRACEELGRFGEALTDYRHIATAVADRLGVRPRILALEAAQKDAGDGTNLVLEPGNGPLTRGDFDADTDQLYDYTFAQAPADWWVQSGTWEVTNRWTCSPGWSWFGGWSDELAAIWNKRAFAGDQEVEVYFSFKMGVAKGWPYEPADVGITICGDGRNVSSGYAFIIGAERDTVTRAYRDGKVVAETRDPKFLLPRLDDGMPDMSELHRRWWSLKVARNGNHVALYLDQQPALEFDDPSPLAAGQVAIWTVHNGIMVARCRISYDRELPAPYLTASVP